MPDNKKVQVSVRLSVETHARLGKLKDKNGTSIQHAVTKALADYLKRQGV
jgi:hypothetical protein